MKHLLGCLLLCLPFMVSAQDGYYPKTSGPAPKRAYTIVLRDGTQLRGDLIRQDSVGTVIRTRNLGEVRLRADQIVRIEQDGAPVPGDVYPALFPQTMRITPTALSAERGRLYFRNYLIYFSQFEYGINDNWSVGTTFFTLAPTNLFSLNTKISVPVSERVRVGVSAQYVALRFGRLLFSDLDAQIGYVQGIVTTGDRQNNTTYGLGWSVSNGSLSKSAIGMFGLVRKLNPGLTFISENFVLFGSGTTGFAATVSAGVRFDRRRHAFDVAAYVPLVFTRNSGSTITFIPFASYHLRIGQ